MRTTYCISMTLISIRLLFMKFFLVIGYSFSKYSHLYWNIHTYICIPLYRFFRLSILFDQSVTSIEYRESVILIEPVFIQYGEKRFRGGAFYIETGLTAIEIRYVFRRSWARKLELYFLVRTKSPIDKKTRIPFLPSRSMDVERIESVRSWEEKGAYTELCGSLTEVHERAPRVRKYMSLLSRGSSYGRQVVADSVRKFRSFREARSLRIPSRPECRPADERTNERINERTSKRAKNSFSCTAKSVACAVRILISAFLR